MTWISFHRTTAKTKDFIFYEYRPVGGGQAKRNGVV
jgi:hypothetical protein